MYHILSWPQLQHVAEDASGKIVGYVLAKMCGGGGVGGGARAAPPHLRAPTRLGPTSPRHAAGRRRTPSCTGT
jgi:peptide alpha-N-acetyltransferase